MKLIVGIFLTILTVTGFSQTWETVGGGTNNSSHGMLVWNGQLVT